MTDLQVTITIDVDSLNSLLQMGAALIVGKSVQDSNALGRPLVWQRMTSYSTNTYVQWTDALTAYTSSSPIAAGQQVLPGFTTPIACGQTLEINGAGGTGEVMASGPATAVTVLDDTSTSWTCGLAQPATAPYCAFPVYPGFSEAITPLDQVLLMFSTSTMPVGTVIDDSLNAMAAKQLTPTMLLATSPGVLVDLTGTTARTVSYSLATGWSWGGYTWASSVGSTTDLVPLLVQPG